MPLFSRDDDSKQPKGGDVVPADAPHAAAYQAGSMEGVPASGRERIARMPAAVRSRLDHSAGAACGAGKATSCLRWSGSEANK